MIISSIKTGTFNSPSLYLVQMQMVQTFMDNSLLRLLKKLRKEGLLRIELKSQMGGFMNLKLRSAAD